MKQIKLTQDKIALVDDMDFQELSKYKWHFDGRYACRKPGSGKVYMHRFILKPSQGLGVDHVNRNKLDNRRENLRLATVQDNACNKGAYSSNKSGYKGVSWFKSRNKWLARVRVGGKIWHLGYFDDKLEAYNAYVSGAKFYHGEFFYGGEHDKSY